MIKNFQNQNHLKDTLERTATVYKIWSIRTHSFKDYLYYILIILYTYTYHILRILNGYM